MSTVVDPLVAVQSLRSIMDNIVAMEELVHDDLLVYRWRPPGPPQMERGGAIWNWIGRAPNEKIDTATWRDTFPIIVRLGIRHSDQAYDMDKFETYCDAFTLRCDAMLDSMRPLAGRRAKRLDMGMVEDAFNEIPVMAMEFVLAIERDKHFTSKSFT